MESKSLLSEVVNIDSDDDFKSLNNIIDYGDSEKSRAFRNVIDALKKIKNKVTPKDSGIGTFLKVFKELAEDDEYEKVKSVSSDIIGKYEEANKGYKKYDNLNEFMLPITDNYGDPKMAFAENEVELEENIFKNTVKKVKDFGNRLLDIPSKEEEAKKQQAIDEIIKFNFESLFLQPVEGQVLNADLAEQRVNDAAKKMPTVKELNPILFEIKGGYFSNATMKIGGKIYRGVIPSCFESIRDVNDEITNEEAIRRMIGFLG